MNNCECFPEIDPQFLADLETETGKPEWHALYTVVLGALVEDGVFDWSKPELDWSNAAYDAEQYARVCGYFLDRYRYQEIAVLPVKQWFNELRTRLVYELMPKYRVLYGEEEKQYNFAFGGLEKGWDVRDITGNETGTSEEHDTASETSQTVTDQTNSASNSETRHGDEYYKGRDIESDYPETLLSSNADYISSGNDTENERVTDGTTTTTGSGTVHTVANSTTSSTGAKTGETEKATTEAMRSSFEHEKEVDTAQRIETLNAYMEAVSQIDKRLLDELEVLFVQVYTANVNGL